jgi:hypothetical protein
MSLRELFLEARMMLLFKAWLESRTRFLLSVAALGGLSIVFVVFNHDARAAFTDRDLTYADYIFRAIFKGHLRDIFVVLALMLGMGGLGSGRMEQRRLRWPFRSAAGVSRQLAGCPLRFTAEGARKIWTTRTGPMV